MSRASKELEFLIKQNLNNLADIPDKEDLIIKYLVHRYENGEVYTWVGPVLLAMNPRTAGDPMFYDPVRWENSTKFSTALQKRLSIMDPHLFAVAASARYRLTHALGKVHQVIVISGDSGSGKTFSASKILRFLAATDQKFHVNDEESSSTLSKIEKACLIVSAFSTASTERNKFSSRHGQLVQLQYLNSSMQGAVMNSFLLERSRVTNECNNFHIFGQMLAGLSKTELESLKLSRNQFYKIINTASNVSGLERTIEAMNSLELGEKQRKEIFKSIALLLHLGNLEFKELVTNGCDVDVNKKDSADALEAACSLLELPIPDLVKLLTTNLIRPCSKSHRHSIYHSAITTTEACNSRLHSIIRYLYHRLFQWLLNRLNGILSCGKENAKLLGILDIFGFEFFSENSIEQLSINYANEKMQDHFMEKYLEASRSELESEGLIALPPPLTSSIYKQRLAAIEGCLFPALNDACLIARIDNRTSLNNQIVLSARKENQRFVENRGEKFTISHFSCTVEYRTADILRKNTDKVPPELLSALTRSQNKFILSLLETDEGKDKPEYRDRPRIDRKKNTALAKLRHSMDALIKELDKYDLHYIRCIKPVLHPKHPEMTKEFKEQLACSGILDALPLARCTLPIRLRYDEFKKRYSQHSEISDETEDPIHACRIILSRVLNEEELISLVHFGSRLIFLAETVLHKLEINREEYRSQCASRIQRIWHKYKLRKRSDQIDESELSQHIDLEDTKAEQVPFFDTKKKGIPRTKKGAEIKDCDRLTNFIDDLNNRAFFYRNRILSRRRLAERDYNHDDKYCLDSCEIPHAVDLLVGIASLTTIGITLWSQRLSLIQSKGRYTY